MCPTDKTLVVLTCALLMTLGIACGGGSGSGDDYSECGDLTSGDFSCSADGRSYLVHVPPSYTGSAPVALVIDMHGYTSTANRQSGLSGWRAKADEQGFIVAWPQGEGNAWNAQGECCGSAKRDDVGFIENVVEAIQAAANIDAGQIFATGLSNGGAMAHTLACESADLFAATAPVAFALAGGDGFDAIVANCNPVAPVPVIHFHGTDDTVVSYDHGILDSLGAQESLDAWGLIQSCDSAQPARQISSSTVCESHSGCDGGVSVVLCTVSSGSHVLYPDVAGASIPDVAWDFFQSSL